MSQPGDRRSSESFPIKPSLSSATAAHMLADDLVERWRRGERVPAEAYLQRHPGLSDELSFELILTEVVLRQEYDDPASLDEFLWRFPHFADRLQRHFALHATLASSSSGGLRSDTTLPPPTIRRLPAALPAVLGYEIIQELGRGGMGVVYRARDASLGRDVALKFLPAEYAGDLERLERFLREARTASALNHPNICTVHALGQHKEQPFIVMEFVEGQTLQALAARRPAVQETAALLRQAARALAAAHGAGVVHRDIKPENIMVRDDGYVKVLDFGLARQLPSFMRDGSDDLSSTVPGAILGTATCMSPEQTRGEAASSASDIFSLGVVLYQLAAGRHPFEAGSTLEMLQTIAAGQPVSLSRLNAAIPVALENLTEAMLHKDPRLRPTAVEVEAILAMLVSGQGRRASATAASRAIVHRKPQLAALRAALDRADAGQGSMVCLVGEPGIGKTTLVEDFVETLTADGQACFLGRGFCSERQADTAAYLPVVDALEDLLRGDGSGSVARLMQLAAPTWYAQLASATAVTSRSRDDGQDIEISERASSQQAMLREFCNLLQEVSRLGRVVLFFDDVHWADAATVDLLAHFGRHCTGLRVVVLVTYRPTELLLGPHPFHRVKLELQGRDACTELAVGFLDREDICAYLSLAFPEHIFPADFADLIHRATEGSPLFMVDLLRYLRERGVIAKAMGRWSLAMELPDLRQHLPESVRSVIQRKLELLDDLDRRLLVAASVRGCDFESAVVARALSLDAADVEERLQRLDRVHGLVRLLREDEFPDRTPTLRCAFVHVLYQQALYAGLQPSRRAALAIALAGALAEHYGDAHAVASQLACLYEVGRDFQRAAQHFWLAAQNAASVFAHREAIVLTRRGLRHLDGVPESAERRALELGMQTTLGMQLQVTQGFAAREAKQAYSRARELCHQAPGAALFPVLWGLWLFSKVRSELPKAQEMADELLALARQLQNPDLALQAHQALGMTAFCRGLPATAIQHVEQSATLYDADRHHTHSFMFGQDPGVICKSFGAVALWLLGYPDQARAQSDEAISMSRRLSPSSRAVAMHFAAMLQQCCRDGSQARARAEASSAIAAEHRFSFWQAGAGVLGGWALAATGSPDEGLDRVRQGLRDWTATESVTYQTYYLGLLAEMLRARGQVVEARRCIEDALALVEQTGERLYEAELYRLKGELSLPAEEDQADDCFYRAVDVARRQEAKSLELRAAMSLARLSRDVSERPKPGRFWPRRMPGSRKGSTPWIW